MEYLSVADIAEKWGLSERSVRNYCADGRVAGAVREGRSWRIPKVAKKPERSNKRTETEPALLAVLRDEKRRKYSGGIYHKTQIELTYNSNHIEGSRLTYDQTRYIFETNTVGAEGEALNVDDIVETVNHFRCVDFIIDNANSDLSERMIKKLHFMLKSGTSDGALSWFSVGDYKKRPNGFDIS